MQPDNRVISTKGFEAMHSDPIEAPEYITGGTTNFTQGGINKYEIPANPSQNDIYLNGKRQGYYGWKGIGGSIFQWHPELDVSISYVMKDQFVADAFNYKASRLQEEVVNIL